VEGDIIGIAVAAGCIGIMCPDVWPKAGLIPNTSAAKPATASR
jgi:hypothetical protein